MNSFSPLTTDEGRPSLTRTSPHGPVGSQRFVEFTFEWDAAKARSNLAKHRISFEEALSAFSDPLSRTIPDPDQSESEQRYVLIGTTSAGRLLVVAHAERGGRIRIINARPASRRERQQYEEEQT